MLVCMPQLLATPYFLYRLRKHHLFLEVWSVQVEQPSVNGGPFRKFLAYIDNSTYQVPLRWSLLREYPFHELRDAYLDAIKHDDDALTQSVEQEELEERIRRCAHFQSRVETWHWMETDHDSEA